jgi:hypothetical protein
MPICGARTYAAQSPRTVPGSIAHKSAQKLPGSRGSAKGSERAVSMYDSARRPTSRFTRPRAAADVMRDEFRR